MRFLLLSFLALTLHACCSGDCPCPEDGCDTEMILSFKQEPGFYMAEQLDTIVNVYKLEGIRGEDTFIHVLQSNGKYSNSSPCALPGELRLHKNVYGDNELVYRVEYYKLYTQIDSVRIDQIDLNVIKSGDDCCSCISDVAYEFRIDSTEVIKQYLNDKPPYVISPK